MFDIDSLLTRFSLIDLNKYYLRNERSWGFSRKGQIKEMLKLLFFKSLND
ncbi:hypothetical protein SAMN04488089_103240 [Myroides profundi]|uniref:Uncharacterized protein n=1 Tax=Myroides profundi TaxID=480520 RepID=A0AAJ4W2S9_MYRPR|nr:hypothetical protein MPR_0784 [Myroides profundi]SEQ47884.1 hypothetical protein SAMN04488089_103240 [Myroides profundi]